MDNTIKLLTSYDSKILEEKENEEIFNFLHYSIKNLKKNNNINKDIKNLNNTEENNKIVVSKDTIFCPYCKNYVSLISKCKISPFPYHMAML